MRIILFVLYGSFRYNIYSPFLENWDRRRRRLRYSTTPFIEQTIKRVKSENCSNVGYKIKNLQRICRFVSTEGLIMSFAEVERVILQPKRDLPMSRWQLVFNRLDVDEISLQILQYSILRFWLLFIICCNPEYLCKGWRKVRIRRMYSQIKLMQTSDQFKSWKLIENIDIFNSFNVSPFCYWNSFMDRVHILHIPPDLRFWTRFCMQLWMNKFII